MTLLDLKLLYLQNKDIYHLAKYLVIDKLRMDLEKEKITIEYLSIYEDDYLYIVSKDIISNSYLDQYLIELDNERIIEEKVINSLKKANLSISSCESCTGMMFISRLISIPGASCVISESYLTYSNEAKQKILKVQDETLNKYTVYSMEVAREMNQGLAKLVNNSLVISTTGHTISNPHEVDDGSMYYVIGLVKKGEYQELNSDFVKVKTLNRDIVRRVFCEKIYVEIIKLLA